MSKKILAFLNIISLLGMIAVNTLANALPINGLNTGELSALYPNEFVPAGYTFSIWLIIYIFLTGFSIYQASVLNNQKKNDIITRLGALFILTNILNSAWIFAWHYQQIALSVLIMLCLLLTLIVIHTRLPIPDANKGLQEKIWVQASFSIYLGWIMTATVANITAYLVSIGWRGEPLTENVWAIIMISIAGVLSLTMLWIRDNKIIPFVTIWSIVGILTRQRAMNGWNIVVLTAAIVCSILVLATVSRLYNRRSELQMH
jgi:hypothetical protein